MAALICRDILVRAYRARERWAECAAQLDALAVLDPDGAPGRATLHAYALARTGRFDDAARLVDGALARDPGDLGAQRAGFSLAVARGELAEAMRLGDALIQRPRVPADDLNEVAWFRLAEGNDLATALDLARRAAAAAPDRRTVRNTLAALEVETGDLAAGLDDNQRSASLAPDGQPNSADWYVAARIDEQLGLVDDAIAIYTRIARPDAEWLSAAAFAQRRLAILRHGRRDHPR